MDVAAKIDRGNDIENIENQLVVKHSLDVTKFQTYHYVYIFCRNYVTHAVFESCCVANIQKD